MSERNGRPGRAYDENHDNWSARTDSPAKPKPTPNAAEELEVVGHIYVVDDAIEDWEWGDKPLLPEDPSLVPLVRQSDALAIIEKLRAEIERWRSNSRDTFEAMVAMRNTINEHVTMPSLESDLITGPENSVFCARVAESVVAEVEKLRAERDAKDFALRNGKSLSEDALHAIREILKDNNVPAAAFIDDHVMNAIVQRNTAEARLAEAVEALERIA